MPFRSLRLFLQLLLRYFFLRSFNFVFVSSILPTLHCTVPLETNQPIFDQGVGGCVDKVIQIN
jgi:pyruvoyl-dependent arginine decarboxylase (PvlArgDC)